jgi:hypothetical protein
MRQFWPPVEMRTVTNQLWLFLQLAAALGLNLGQFIQILKVSIRNRLIGQLPQMLGWL